MNRKLNVFRLIGCLMFLIVSHFSLLYAQDDKYDQPWRWVHFTKEDGLSSNIIVGVIEATDGTVWAISPTGIVWYDGFRWNAVDSLHGTLKARPGNFNPDLNGGLFMQVGDELYEGNKQGIIHIPFHGIRTYAALSQEHLLLIINDTLYDYDGKHIVPFPSPPIDTSATGRVALFRTTNGRIWLEINSTLYTLQNKSWKLFHTFDAIVSSLVENKSGSGILALKHPLGLGFYEWGKNFEPILNKREDSNLLDALDISPDGQAIAITEFTEVRLRTNNQWAPVSLFPSPSPHINSVVYRPNGDLWVCTENGLYLYRRSLNRWTVRKDPVSISKNLINDILVTKNKTLVIASDAGVEFTPTGGPSRLVINALGQSLRRLTAIGESDDGKIWIGSGTFFPGAYCWDGRQWSFSKITGDTSNIFVHKIVKDHEGRLWFLGLGKSYERRNQPGAFVYDHGKFIRWGEPEGLPSGRVYSFAEGADSTYWFGTLAGISKWHRGEWQHWQAAPIGPFLRGYTLALDHLGTLWFGAYDYKGLGILDLQGNILFHNVSTGFLNDQVKNIVCDSLGNIWVGTMGGVAYYNHDTWSYFDDKVGLLSLNVWTIVRTGDKVLIGTIGGGVCTLDMSEEHDPPPKTVFHEPVIEKDRVLLRWQTPSYWGQLPQEQVASRYRIDNTTWSTWGFAKEVQLKDLASGSHSFQVQAKGLFGNYDPAGEQIAFTIPVPFYQHPLFEIPILSLSGTIVIMAVTLFIRKRRATAALRKSELRFRRLTEATFEGIVIHDEEKILDVNESLAAILDRNRNEMIGHSIYEFIASESHEIMHSHVHASVDHSFEIIGIKKDGSFISLEIEGKQIPYENRTVRVEAIRDITERKFAEEQLLQYQEELRSLAVRASLAENRERQKMATYVHDQIIQSLAFCKMQLSALQETLPPDKVVEPLRIIDELLDQLINDSRSLIFTLSPPVLHQLGFEPAITWFIDLFRKHNNLEIHYTYDRQPFQLSDDMKVVLFDSVRELFVNAMKHARASIVSLDLRTEGECLVIRITDNGIGFDVNKMNAQLHTTEQFGLFNIQERLKHLGCDLDIESVLGKGSSFTIIAPLHENLNSKG